MLNETQLDLLRHICRQTRPIPAEELDGRVCQALARRGLVEVRGFYVEATRAGRGAAEQSGGAKLKRPRRSRNAARATRASMIERAVEQLREAIPAEAEVRVGNIQAAADDVLEGLRRYARRAERG